jgi:hypothetical protein
MHQFSLRYTERPLQDMTTTLNAFLGRGGEEALIERLEKIKGSHRMLEMSPHPSSAASDITPAPGEYGPVTGITSSG